VTSNGRNCTSQTFSSRRHIGVKTIKYSPSQIRDQVDKKNRHGFFTLLRAERIIAMEPDVADNIINDFWESQKKTHLAVLVQGLSKSESLHPTQAHA
jgi:hypothetical protein